MNLPGKTMSPNFSQHLLTGVVLAANLAVIAPAACADTRYDSSAALGFTIDGIASSNPDNADDLTGLTLTASFVPAVDPDSFYADSSGDGVYRVDNPKLALTFPENRRFAGTFAVSGNSPLHGSVNSLHTGDFVFSFSNDGPYRYTLNATLDYSLHASAVGVYANSFILLDYWNSIDEGAGMEYSGAGTYIGHANDSHTTSGSFVWAFALDPGADARFVARTAIQSSLDSTPIVPIPASLWLFIGASLGLTNLRKVIVAMDSFGRVPPT